MEYRINEMGDYVGKVIAYEGDKALVITEITKDSYVSEKMDVVSAAEYIKIFNELQEYKKFKREILKALENLNISLGNSDNE